MWKGNEINMATKEKVYQNRLREKYEKEIMPKLAEDLGVKNMNAVPKLEKIVINMGVGNLIKDKAAMDKATEELAAITGQKPQSRPAKSSIAGFGIRAGMPVGLRVTLRGDRMYSFLDKLISIVFPRLRDFRGISNKKFDKAGNYSIGFVEHTVFPEIDLAKVDKLKGLEITIVNTAKDEKAGKMLMTYLGMPFEKEE
jgi:large subunit ribosomal protein L5